MNAAEAPFCVIAGNPAVCPSCQKSGQRDVVRNRVPELSHTLERHFVLAAEIVSPLVDMEICRRAQASQFFSDLSRLRSALGHERPSAEQQVEAGRGSRAATVRRAP